MTHPERTRPSVQAMIAACHPGPTLAVVLVTALLAVGVGLPAGTAVLVSAAVLAGQLSIGWGNDWLDRERDLRADRRDKPLAQGRLSAVWVLRAAVLALVACVPLSLACGWLAGTLHLVAVASGWAYNLGIKASVASAAPFVLSFGLLPAFVVAAAPGPVGPPVWLVTAGALLGAGAHLVNVLPDLADDEAAGIRGLGHALGATRATLVAVGCLVTAIAVVAFGPPGPVGGTAAVTVVAAVAVGVTGGIQARRRPGSRVAFMAVLVIAVAAVALLVGSGSTLA